MGRRSRRDGPDDESKRDLGEIDTSHDIESSRSIFEDVDTKRCSALSWRMEFSISGLNGRIVGYSSFDPITEELSTDSDADPDLHHPSYNSSV